jgi:uncharacterized protein (TIGR03437 family)
MIDFLRECARVFAGICGVVLIAIVAALACSGQTVVAPGAVASGTLVPAPGSPYITGSRTAVVASGDFNGDGLADLVVGTSEEIGTLTILLATRDGGFVPAPGGPISVEWANDGLAIADFNEDGNLDIASIGTSIGPTGLQIFLGDGRGGFSPMAPIELSSVGMNDLSGIDLGDFNHDGKTDLVIVGASNVGLTSSGAVAILLGDGTGNFTSAVGSPFQTAQPPARVTVADFNVDGNLDVAVTNETTNQVTVLLGNGNGQLLSDPKGPFATGRVPIAIVHGDFNGDGKVDLAVGNWFDGTLTILLGDGTGGFTGVPESHYPTGFTPQWLAVGDIDGDGILDLAVAVANGNDSELLILQGDGDGGFAVPVSGNIEFSGGPVGVTIADFNGDGRLDVATANLDGGTTSVFLGAPAASMFTLVLASSNPTVGVPLSFTTFCSPLGFDPATGTVTLQDGSVMVATASLDLCNATFQETVSTAGAHNLMVVYAGDLRTTGSTSPPLTINVGKGSQTISFPTLPNHSYGDPPFSVPAFSSSQLPVTLTVISGPATISGNVLTLTGTGVVTLQASQPGNANYLPAPSVQQQFQVTAPSLRIDAILNAASYGAGSFAPNSFAVVFGTDLATLASAVSLGTTLGGTSIQIKDASGKVSNALLYYSSPAQTNFILPSGLSPGMATLTLQTQAGLSTMTSISIAAVDPGLFSADASGTGVAAGGALRVSADGTQTPLAISSCGGQPLVCTAIPIDLGADTDTVYLSLYGTGIRGRSALAAVTATIGGIVTDVQYAGAQPAYPGLDQVNLQLNPALRGRGSVQIALTVDGIVANVVTVAIQ